MKKPQGQEQPAPKKEEGQGKTPTAEELQGVKLKPAPEKLPPMKEEGPSRIPSPEQLQGVKLKPTPPSEPKEKPIENLTPQEAAKKALEEAILKKFRGAREEEGEEEEQEEEWV